MPTLSSVDRKQLHRAFMEAFADYQMDASGTTEERLFLRMGKNAVDYDLSVGAYDGDRLIGFTLIGVDDWGGKRVAFDAGTGIVPAFRNQGLAKEMFGHALPRLADQAVTQFVLEVLQGNEPAIRAYTKSGFEIAREFRCYAGELPRFRTMVPSERWTVREASLEEAHSLEPDWTPSFENRCSIPAQLGNQVTLFGAFDGEHCVGLLGYIPSLHWLQGLVVAESHRRQGIGTALLHHLATQLPEEAKRLPVINVDRSDTGMEAFFEALGCTHLVDQFEMTRDL